MLDKLQKLASKIVGPPASLESLAQRENVAHLSVYYRYNFGRCSSKLAELVPFPHSCERCTCYFNTLHDFSVSISRY